MRTNQSMLTLPASKARFPRYALAFILGCWALFLAGAVEASEMSANNGSVGLRTKDVDLTWRFFDPHGFEDIRWFTGENTADGLTFNERSAGTEPKFIRNPLRGRGWTGFTNSDRGPQGSVSITSGAGSSYSQTTRKLAPKWNAEFRLTADGVLGGSGGAVEWSSTATGKDPFFVFPADLDELGVTGSTFDLLLTQSLDTLSLSDLGSFEWHSYIETNSSTIDILSISGDKFGVAVTGNPAVLYFQQPVGSEADVDELVALTLEDIMLQLAGDLVDGLLDSPLLLTMYYPDFLIPLDTLSNGAILAAHLDGSIHDADSDVNVVTEPPSILLLAASLLGLFLFRARSSPSRRASSV